MSSSPPAPLGHSGCSAYGRGLPGLYTSEPRWHLQSVSVFDPGRFIADLSLSLGTVHAQQAREANAKVKPFRTCIVERHAQHLATDGTADDSAAVVAPVSRPTLPSSTPSPTAL